MTEQVLKQHVAKGEFETAIHLALSMLNEKYSHDVQYILAVAYRMSAKWQEAVVASKRILSELPEYARAHQELGYTYKSMGELEASARHFYLATQYNPMLIGSWKALINHYQSTGNTKALKIATSHVEFLNSQPPAIIQARDLVFEGKLNDADQLTRRFLQQNKHHPDGLTLLAEIGIALKVFGEAEFLLETCLELYPTHLPAGIEYVKLLIKMGQFAKANRIAEKFLSTHQEHLPLMTAKANALVGIGSIDEAIALYQILLTKLEDSAAIHLLLGHAHKAKGNLQEAIASYRSAYKLKPEMGDAYWSLANTKTYRFSESEIEQMQQQLELPISTDDRVHLSFALGKAFEDRKQYAQSFEFYEQGNSLKSSLLGYHPDFIQKQVDNQKRIFTKTLFSKLSNVGHDAPDPIFIVGLPRSGSTLLEQILASHSQVDGTMELHNIIGLVARLKGQKNRFPDIVETLQTQYFEEFGKQYIKETAVYRQNAPFFIDKMPNNFMFIGLIKLILPNAKIIDARREPMACCFSCFKQLFGEGQEFTYGLDNIGKYYNSYLDVMDHWNEVLPGHVLKVQHEDVLEDLEGQVRRLLDFCGLPFEQSCVEYYKTERAIKTPSSEQVRQPIFKSSMELWKNYDEFLAPLKDLVNK